MYGLHCSLTSQQIVWGQPGQTTVAAARATALAASGARDQALPMPQLDMLVGGVNESEWVRTFSASDTSEMFERFAEVEKQVLSPVPSTI